MSDDHIVDEMIEILPDEVPGETEGLDRDVPAEDSDMTIVPEKTVDPDLEDDEDADMKIVPERVPIAELSRSESVLTADTLTGPALAGGDEDADMTVENAGPEGSTFEDDYSREIYELEHEDDDRDLIEEIDASLQEQNRNSLVADVPLMGLVIDGSEHSLRWSKIKERLKKIPLWAYIVSGISLAVIIGAIFFFATDLGKSIAINGGSGYIADKMIYSPVVELPVIDIPDDLDLDMKPDVEVVDESVELELPEVRKKPEAVGTDQKEQKVYNILLLGEENIESGGGRGRSDLIMIATINEEDGSIKLTSVMRDILVAIPGHSDNRLNAAYAMGGVSLVYQTLANNLGVDIDNYAKVNFESFEKIIDAIGGVDIELTEEEAAYLNRTNYISNEKYRNVKAGKNHFNGNQALGYCRIRKVGTSGREYSDFGRTSRQRMLLESIVTSIKDMNLKQLKRFCDKCLPYVTTDIDEETLEKYMKAVINIGLDKKIRDYRIPIDGTYSDANLRGMLVTKVDLRKNALELHDFIYGE